MEEKNELLDEISKLKLELEEERNSKTTKGTGLNNNVSNHLDDGENESKQPRIIDDFGKNVT
jgi:hypothetical protein